MMPSNLKFDWRNRYTYRQGIIFRCSRFRDNDFDRSIVDLELRVLWTLIPNED
jgi:hypothetical protein